LFFSEEILLLIEVSFVFLCHNFFILPPEIYDKSIIINH
jgi:hypothetical protein